MRELEHNLGTDSPYSNQLPLFTKVLKQRRNDKNKIYSRHESEVECISKGKEHKKYEFGNKVSIIRSIEGVIIRALSFRKEHDVRTLNPAMDQVSRLTTRKVKLLAGIEPTISLLKSDHMGRNFYKGLQGDAINVMLAAAAYNFKRAMRALWSLIEIWFLTTIKTAEQVFQFPDRLKFGC